MATDTEATDPHAAPEAAARDVVPEAAAPEAAAPTSYTQALAVLKDALRFGIDPTLENVQALCSALGEPQSRFAAIQIAGTNGKSSTARFTAAILRAHGQRVGLYTSPELVFSEERIECDGRVVRRTDFARAILQANAAAEQLILQRVIAGITEFELLTAAALWLFANKGLRFAVLEVGLGGRWDATSVVSPKVAVITGVDFDHTDILGSTITEIAAEKAAIIKPGSRVVLGPGIAAAREVFFARAAAVGAEPVEIAQCPPYLRGPYADLRFSGPAYQAANIACAIAACEAALGFAPRPELVQQALDKLVIPGRFELLRARPPLLIDAAHNPQSARFLAQALLEYDAACELGSNAGRVGHKPGAASESDAGREPGGAVVLQNFDTLLLGILADKDVAGIIAPLAPLFCHIAVTRSRSPRAVLTAQLAAMVERACGRVPEQFSDVAAALSALSERGASVVATGSITIAGEVKGALSLQ
ncbi:MAG: bifunctional folylpolyglutamate synthase/dihydrofolate synthase [Coriobacteriales bacterium]|jgi:dihydrofolate synthase/folylpolyglutamate synthase|nr:bifunctional folylpolyglutamate synthase/dihydrofolate synthase [Coriobacteriales bacterium]